MGATQRPFRWTNQVSIAVGLPVFFKFAREGIFLIPVSHFNPAQIATEIFHYLAARLGVTQHDGVAAINWTRFYYETVLYRLHFGLVRVYLFKNLDELFSIEILGNLETLSLIICSDLLGEIGQQYLRARISSCCGFVRPNVKTTTRAYKKKREGSQHDYGLSQSIHPKTRSIAGLRQRLCRGSNS